MNSEKPLVIVTGASKGIGKETAELFSKNYFKVFNISRSENSNPKIHNILVDLVNTDDKTIQQTVLSHLPKQGRIILVHNASVCYNDTVESFNLPDWQTTLRLNITIPALLSQWILPHMSPQSAIIFVGSTLSEKAVGNTFSYTVSKHAIAGLMRSLCQDLAGRSIHTCCVCPGITDTEMLRGRVGNNTNLLAKLAQVQSNGRLLNPDEIAEAIFMAATHSIFNGAILHANGGQIEA